MQKFFLSRLWTLLIVFTIFLEGRRTIKLPETSERPINDKVKQLPLFVKDPPYHILGNVELLYWSPKQELVSYVKALQRPIIFRKTVVDTWPARRLWNPNYFKEKIPRLRGVKISPNATILYFNGKENHALAGISGIPAEEPYTVAEMTTSNFFERIADDNDPMYYYFSNNINLVKRGLLKDISPLDPLVVRKEGKTINLWIGKPGVTAHAHYDATHNFFVQLFGRKRFLLFPPREHIYLYLYPRHHPYFRQSQVDFNDPNLDVFPEFSKAFAFEAYLEEGDLLYLPPYWFHHVTALDVSISVNVWCHSEEQLLYEKQILTHVLPFENDWNLNKKIVVVTRFLTLLVDGIQGHGTASNFMKQFVNNSFAFLLSTSLHNVSTLDFKICMDPSDQRNDVNQYPRQHLSSDTEHPTEASLSPSDKAQTTEITMTSFPELNEKLAKNLETLIALFLHMKRTSPEGIWNIYLRNYIEEVALWAVGVENYAHFIAYCLAKDRKSVV